MKNLQITFLLFAPLLLSPLAPAQTGGLPEAPQFQDAPLTQPQSTPATNRSATPEGENKIISQAGTFPRFPPRPIMPPRGRAYPSAFRPGPPPLSPVGALIGIGIGGALGAASSGDHTARGRVAGALIGGGLCALIGGAIGNAFSAVSSHNFHDDDRARRNRHGIAPTAGERDVNAVAAPKTVQPVDSQEAQLHEIDTLASATH